MCVQAASNPEMVEEDEETLCVVCMDKLWEVIFYNCMHMVCPHTLGIAVCHSHVTVV